MDLEERLRVAVARAYRTAGLKLSERDLASLASVYAAWAEGMDLGVVDRIERALLRSLGLAAA